MTSPGIYTRRYQPTDPRLGRHVHFDARSARYAIAPIPTSLLQEQAWELAIGILDQQNSGACTGNAGTYDLGCSSTIGPGLTGVTIAGKTYPLDETFARDMLYSQATQIDPFPGAYIPGDPSSEDTGSDGLSVAKVLKSWSLIDSYSHAFDVNALYAALQAGPVMLGIPWMNSMFDPGPNGLLTVDEKSGIAGGHELLATHLMLDASGKPARLRGPNSWGEQWGDGGYWEMKVADGGWLLSQQGDVISTRLRTVAPTPDPGSGAPFLGADLVVAARIVRAASRAKLDLTGYQNHHWKSYFDIK